MGSFTAVDFACVLAMSLCVLGIAKTWQRLKDKNAEKRRETTP